MEPPSGLQGGGVTVELAVADSWFVSPITDNSESSLLDSTNRHSQQLRWSLVWAVVRFLHFTKFLTVHQKNLDQIYIISGVLSDRYERYSKEYSCLSNYGHTHACDNYYTNMYIISHLIE